MDKLILPQSNVFLKINSFFSDNFSPTTEVPQGSVVAPTLSITYVSGFPQLKEKISQFAYKFALFYRLKKPQIKSKTSPIITEQFIWLVQLTENQF